MNETHKSYKVSAIVCAFNEETTIRGVMDALLTSPLIDEVIAVDDGSKDGTAGILKDYRHMERVKIILLPQNRGKGCGMSMAAASAKGDLLCFVDADLVNLSEYHIAMMSETFIGKELDMLMGSPVRGKTISFSERLDPFLKLTGQRVLYRKDFLQLSEAIYASGYGVETILNDHYREQGKRVHFIHLPYLIHPIKFEKSGMRKAIAEYVLEGREIMSIKLRKQQLFWQSVLFADHRN